MARTTKTRRRNKRRRKKHFLRRLSGWKLFSLVLVCVAVYCTFLDFSVRHQFEGKRWELPARVYARPLELYVGKPMYREVLELELKGLRYQFVRDPRFPGEVARSDNGYVLTTRPFLFWDGRQASREIRIELEHESVSGLYDLATGKMLDLVRLDPELIGVFYPSHKEDRILVRLDEVPRQLLGMLVALEDRNFYSHHGIDVRAISRATLANLRAGRVVQGGSTLTQQLVKNLFLSSERTFVRKINEAIMSLLLELHYSKQEILEAYLNEVYLGQDGQRAVHGFGLASQYYFERSLADLSLDRMALLVALVKGASFYDPKRNPERAEMRRNLVLRIATKQGVLSSRQYQQAMKQPLAVVKRRSVAANRYPAFMDLVKRQLRRDYREEDLTTEGLNIFTTLDPWAQDSLEQALEEQLPLLESKQQLAPGLLQAAGVVTTREGAEVLALVGGREPRYAGFNRALDANRPVGSIIKPAVYLAALQNPDRYTLATLLDDSPITVTSRYGADWEPQNYGLEFHGPVLLQQALAYSFNVPTVRLGLELGLSRVIETLQRMGLEEKPFMYPSLLLGALALSPMEVIQLYQTLASGGFRSPLRAIRAVVEQNGNPLQRYPISVQQVFEPEPIYLVNSALQAVVHEGTGRRLTDFLPATRRAAGKTGTTDDLRDSWFAGFTGDRLAVVWLGRDDNQPTGLTGSSGAMRVWGSLMAKVGVQELQLTPSPSIRYEWVDIANGLRSNAHCKSAVQLPFIVGSAPNNKAKCSASGKGGVLQWFRGR